MKRTFATLTNGKLSTGEIPAGLEPLPEATLAALAGTSGTPGPANKYVTNDDARNTNARTPTTHEHAGAAGYHAALFMG